MIDFIQPQRSLLTKQSWMLVKMNYLKIMKNTIKKRLKAEIVTMTYPDGNNIRISNYVKIINKHQVRFDPPRELKNP